MESRESAGEVIWFVSVAPDRVRALTVDELDAAYQSGSIDEDTLVRRDGELTWSKLGAAVGIEPRELEDEVEVEIISMTRIPPTLPPPLPSRASKPRSWRERLLTWGSFTGQKVRAAVRRRPYVAIGVAAGLVSLLAVLLAVRIARPSAASEVATSVALAPRAAVNAARPAQVAPPRKVVAPLHPAATKPAPAAPIHPVAAKPALANKRPPAKQVATTKR
jgi:hypothetical protein